MISVYALSLIRGLTTEEEILEVEDQEYLDKVLKKRDEFLQTL